MKFKVITGIFAGLNFEGEVINGRVHNNETTGQSYPLENCEATFLAHPDTRVKRSKARWIDCQLGMSELINAVPGCTAHVFDSFKTDPEYLKGMRVKITTPGDKLENVLSIINALKHIPEGR